MCIRAPSQAATDASLHSGGGGGGTTLCPLYAFSYLASCSISSSHRSQRSIGTFGKSLSSRSHGSPHRPRSFRPANAGPNIGLMLGQRRRRWTNIKPISGLVFPGIMTLAHRQTNIRTLTRCCYNLGPAWQTVSQPALKHHWANVSGLMWHAICM